MKTRRNKLPKKALLVATAAPKLRAEHHAELLMGLANQSSSEDEDQLVRTSEAAHRLNVSENTIRKYLAAGLLQKIRIGTRTIRITRASLLKLMGQGQAAE